jgi:hypothetical protein
MGVRKIEKEQRSMEGRLAWLALALFAVSGGSCSALDCFNLSAAQAGA